MITGAGPGIMEAGIEGAGPEHAFGVSIKLPFETTTSQFFDGDPKLVNFRYFFTRKLAFIKESDGFVLLPGGFGTLDEAFELLTLLQTGKAQPGAGRPARHPGRHLLARVDRLRASASCVATGLRLAGRPAPRAGHRRRRRRGRRAASASTATTTRMRFVDGQPRAARCTSCRPPHELAALVRRVRRHRRAGRRSRSIAATRPRSPTTTTSTSPRIAFRFDRRGWSRLRVLIDRLNGRSAP